MRPEGVREWRKTRRASLKGISGGRRCVYRLRVTFPTGHDRPGWRPDGWHDSHDLNEASWITGEVKPCTVQADGTCEWEARNQGGDPFDEGGSEFIRPDNAFRWPSADRRYLSRSGALKRATLLRSYGAVVEIESSNPITWPDETAAAAEATATTAQTTPNPSERN